MKRRARFSAERVANAQVRQLEDERRVRDGREVVTNAWEFGLWDVDGSDSVEPRDRVRLLYGLTLGGRRV